MTTKSKSIFWGIFCIVGSIYMFLAAAGVWVPEDTENAPSWVLCLCGVVFGGGGIALCTNPNSKMRLASVGVILIGMSGVATWAALLSEADNISGGLPFVSDAVNVAIARSLAGFGAILCLLLLRPLLRDFQNLNRKP